MFVVKGKRKPVDRVVFSPDGGRIAWASAHGLAYVYDFASAAKPLQLAAKIAPDTLTFTPDGGRLVAWDEDAVAVICLDAATGGAAWTAALENGRLQAMSLVADADGRSLWAAVIDVDDFFSPANASGVRRLDLADGSILDVGPAWGSNHHEPKFAAATPDGATLVVAGGLSLHTFDRTAGMKPIADRFIAEGVDGPSLSADGRRLAFTGTLHATVVAVPGLKTVRRIDCDDPRYAVGGRVGSCVLTPDGKRLLTANNGKFVALIDVATGSVVGSWSWDVGKLRSVAVAPDGLRAAAGSDTGRVVVWDLDA